MLFLDPFRVITIIVGSSYFKKGIKLKWWYMFSIGLVQIKLRREISDHMCRLLIAPISAVIWRGDWTVCSKCVFFSVMWTKWVIKLMMMIIGFFWRIPQKTQFKGNNSVKNNSTKNLVQYVQELEVLIHP